MENQIYHLVYLTTNLINGKIYVGVHSTYNLEDGYLGSGKTLNKAIQKYGKENFKRETLHFCLTAKDAYFIESQIVDSWFVDKKDNYNCKLGGHGGWNFINNNQYIKRKALENSLITNNKIRKENKENNIPHPNKGKKRSDDKKIKVLNHVKSEKHRKIVSESNKKVKRKENLSQETLEKMSKSAKARGISEKCKARGKETAKENPNKLRSEEFKRNLSLSKTGLRKMILGSKSKMVKLNEIDFYIEQG